MSNVVVVDFKNKKVISGGSSRKDAKVEAPKAAGVDSRMGVISQFAKTEGVAALASFIADAILVLDNELFEQDVVSALDQKPSISRKMAAQDIINRLHAHGDGGCTLFEDIMDLLEYTVETNSRPNWKR